MIMSLRSNCLLEEGNHQMFLVDPTVLMEPGSFQALLWTGGRSDDMVGDPDPPGSVPCLHAQEVCWCNPRGAVYLNPHTLFGATLCSLAVSPHTSVPSCLFGHPPHSIVPTFSSSILFPLLSPSLSLISLHLLSLSIPI